MLRLPSFRYRAPKTVAEAVSWLAEDPSTTMVVAGGTDLLVQMKSGMRAPGVIVQPQSEEMGLDNVSLSMVKLVAVPAAVLGVGVWLGLSGLQLQIAVMFGALPTASSAYILAQRMGGNGALVAVQISLGTVVSAATIPLWLTAAQMLGR